MATEDDIIAELRRRIKYPCVSGSCGAMPLPPAIGTTYLEAAWRLAQSTMPRHRAVGLWALSRCIPVGETETLPDGRSTNSRQLLLEALECDPALSIVYANLAREVSGQETVRLLDGRTLSEQELFLEAVRCDPSDGNALVGLSSTLDGGTIAVDGRDMTALELNIDAARLDPADPVAFFNIGVLVRAGETVQLSDGREVNSLDMFLESLRLDPTSSETFHAVAATLSPHETVRVGGCELSATDLFVEAIRCNPRFWKPYYCLASRLFNPGSTVALADGRTLTAAQLYTHAALHGAPESQMQNLGSGILAQCAWSPACHQAFGLRANMLMGALLLSIRRLEGSVVVRMDPALLEETLMGWSLADSVFG